MPLTHVCVWDSKIGYRRVSVEEACEMYPYGASARSGCFVCELCAANVLLTAPGVNIQHFRHDPAAPNKECDERQSSFDPTYGRALRGLNSHVMPLRITVNGSSFALQLGFFYPPDKKAYCEKIRIATDTHNSFEYNFERIERIGTTYLNVGTVPSRIYGLNYVNANAELLKYWSDKATGVNSSGSFFDARTGHILLPGAKAYSGNSYYLLQRRQLYLYSGDIEASELCRVPSGNGPTWYLYKIRVRQFTSRAAKFFLSYSIFLTEKPTQFYPIWPAYISDPHFIYHNSSDFYFYICGDDAELKAYPATSSVMGTHEGKLYKLFTREREQLISIGKSGALGFSYLIKQSLNKKAPLPKLIIRDSAETDLCDDIYTKLPKAKYITVSCQYDGKAVVRKNQKTHQIYRISPDQDTIIDDLSFGTEISFYHGCDCVRTLSFVNEKRGSDALALDNEYVKKLRACSGPMISIPHSMGAITSRFSCYPQTSQWIFRCIRSGEIPRSAYRLLQAYMSTAK